MIKFKDKYSMVMFQKPKLVVILRPTASGKSTLTVKLAKKFKGEIVSADSRQIYRQMDIGTAKPTKKELKIVPHHLIDIKNPAKISVIRNYWCFGGKI